MKIENIDDLHVLVQTARTGTLTAAAHALGVTSAAASATLKRLETQLGVRLFERSTRAMRLTSRGQTLLDYATRALDLLPWLDEFMQTHPGVRLALSVGDRRLDVVRDELDLALRYGTLADSRLVVRRLMTAEPVVVAAPSYLQRHGAPKSPLDLTGHNCLAYDRAGRPHRTWRFLRGKKSTEVRVNGDRSVDDASLARQWALAGAGILLKTPIEQRHEMADGRLVRLLRDWRTESYPLHALLPSGRFLPHRVKALVDFLATKFEAVAVELAHASG